MEEKDKIQNVQLPVDNKILSTEEMQGLDNATIFDKLRRLNLKNTNAPTHTPQSFQEQFYLQDGGFLWVYMNGTWVKINPTPATQIAVGYGASPTSNGTQAITGVGFTPKLILVYANKVDDPDQYTISSHSRGHASTTADPYCLIYFYRAGAINKDMQSASAHLVDLIGTDGARKAVADLDSIDADGFTFDWTTTTIACDYMWECIG